MSLLKFLFRYLRTGGKQERAGGKSFRLFPKSRIVMLYDLTLTAEQVAALQAQLAARARRKAIFQIWPIGLLRFLFWRVE